MKQSFVILFIMSSSLCSAQVTDENLAVMKPINDLFTAMKMGDSLRVRNVFTKTVSMATVSIDKEGKPSLRKEVTIDNFLKAIGTPHPEVYNEMIWDATIQIDGNMAQVWTKYAFYVGKKFSHCGVDAFQLFKDSNDSWKIFHLADTRQKEGCKIPSAISDQFN